ncbi:mitochondrial inner membrane protein COX18-like [Acanthaster planci]|uniref:Mitochondrial inner membrane protein COX18-like n=1 Tax=Acanthaster planci TaxID=133434 RepID=A0A8B7ZUT6_ACAPL|nr:mitochondrial inner membrane protein COX18-like [Acanthaster planci]XP_022108857.1 mitochondrial inner membrane protein COX18-like [Acanthaster planci]XP_022108934.1 mitochondrial inner membrane protein COX18-like [Acanthaster planci]
MAVTRLTRSLLNDQRVATCIWHHVQWSSLHTCTTATGPTLTLSCSHRWRTRNYNQPHPRAFSNMARLQDFWGTAPVTFHLPSHKTALAKSACPAISFVSSRTLPRRCLSVESSSSYGYIPTPVECSYEFLERLQETSALPWWLTILATTLLVRGTLVLPFAVWQQQVLAKIENVQPEINTHAEHMKQQVALMAKELNWSQKEMANFYSQQVKFIVKRLHFDNRCQSRKIFYVGFVQAGIWSSLTIAIGQMTGRYPELFGTEPDVDYIPELTTQGALWFSDLTQFDFLMPVMLGLVNLALVEMWSLRRGPLTLLQHRLVNWFRLVSLGMVPIATMMPAALSLFWLSSSLAGLGQYALLRWPAFRRLVNIPQSPSEMKHPWQEMRQAFRVRYFSKKMF